GAGNPRPAAADQSEAPGRIRPGPRGNQPRSPAGGAGQPAGPGNQPQSATDRLPAAHHRPPQRGDPSQPARAPASGKPDPERAGPGRADRGAEGQPAAGADSA